MKNAILIKALLWAFCIQASSTFLWGQGTAADFERAENLRRLTENKVFRDRIQAKWISGNNHFWYQVKTAIDSHEFILVDVIKGERKPAFDHEKLAKAMHEAGIKGARSTQLPIEKLEFKLDQNSVDFQADGKSWHCDLGSYELRELKSASEEKSIIQPLENIPRASRRTGEETSLAFVNKTQGDVEIFWLNTEGERVSYGKLAAGGKRDQHTFEGHVWIVNDSAGKMLGVYEAGVAGGTAEITNTPVARTAERREGRPPRTGRNAASRDTSPDGQWRAFIRDNNVVAVNITNKQETMISNDGTAEDAYSGRLYWSPDSKKLVAVRTKKAQEHKVYLIESSPKDQLQPKLQSYDYLKPGDRVAVDRPQLFDLSTLKKIPVNDSLFSNPYDITGIRWLPDSSAFTFIYNQRGHQVLRIVAVDSQSGDARPVVDEKSDTFINYSGHLFVEYLDDTQEIIWMSERDNWNHLYLYDAKNGKVKNQITRGDWVVRGVEKVDREKRQIWFRASGIYPAQDPYYIHFARINFDGSGLIILTEGDGTHAIEYSPDQRFFIDTYSRVDMPPVRELRQTDDGTLVCPLEKAQWDDLLKAGWLSPERFTAKGRDGQTDIYGIIIRPTNFNPNKKYPVIENIYAGPQDSFVPKSFNVLNRMQELAEIGFILVQIDGMGTDNRSKKFHDVCWKNLGDSGFPDRILWLKAAAAKYPFMDLTRVGIYGGSAGGQSALRAVLAHGDFYKAAAADCGCHDNRMDKIWWNEQWMGWPIGPHYEEQSNVTQAHKLQGKLLLMVGELDRNVDPASTMQVVNALIKADKDFELIVFPGAGHGAGGSPYGRRRMTDFFVRNLLGVEPQRPPKPSPARTVAATAQTEPAPSKTISNVGRASIQIDASIKGPEIDPRLYGIFLEEINHGVDGGLYAELLRNRAFEDAKPPEGFAYRNGQWVDEKGYNAGYHHNTNGLPYWKLIKDGDARGSMHLDMENPLNAKTPRSLRLEIETDSGRIGVANEGFWGIAVNPSQEFQLSFYARRSEEYEGALTATLENTDGEGCSSPVKIEGLNSQWQQFKATLIGSKTAAKARLVILASGKGKVWFDFVSLFPKKTWKNRPNGLRADLAQMIADMKPGFVRFPGGCVVEGGTIETAYNWKDTIGPLVQRQETWGAWQYRRTHGMGFLEYLQYCEDLGAEPLHVGFAGQSCLFREAENVPMDNMGWVATNFLDAIEYANGDPTTAWGQRRAKDGRAKPFQLKLVEIGNENGTKEFPERYKFIHSLLKTQYPNLSYIADLSWISRQMMGDAKFDIEDNHFYNSPNWFMNNQNLYTKRDRKLPPVYVGEIAVTSGEGGNDKGNLISALSEGAFLLGCEKNADVVKMVSYAPLLAHVNGRSGWHGMIYFDSARAYGTVSYYLWKLFGTNRPDYTVKTEVEFLPSTRPAITGAIGVGTWNTSAEYTNIQVEKDGAVLYRSDFTQKAEAWKPEGGSWSTVDGAYRQKERVVAQSYFGDDKWSNYILTLKARKISGPEGFLIIFGRKGGDKYWWNIGGWGNREHAIEFNQSPVGRHVPGTIEANRWYDIKVELKERLIRCYLDGKLIHEAEAYDAARFFASAGREECTGDLILKVINTSPEPVVTDLNTTGFEKMSPKAQITVLKSARLEDNNSMKEPQKVVPVNSSINSAGTRFEHTFPAQSLTVLRVKKHD